MDIHEVAYQTATDIMKWSYKYDNENDYYQDEQHQHVMDVHAWEPTENIHQAWMLIEKIKKTKAADVVNESFKTIPFTDISPMDICKQVIKAVEEIETKERYTKKISQFPKEEKENIVGILHLLSGEEGFYRFRKHEYDMVMDMYKRKQHLFTPLNYPPLMQRQCENKEKERNIVTLEVMSQARKHQIEHVTFDEYKEHLTYKVNLQQGSLCFPHLFPYTIEGLTQAIQKQQVLWAELQLS